MRSIGFLAQPCCCWLLASKTSWALIRQSVKDGYVLLPFQHANARDGSGSDTCRRPRWRGEEYDPLCFYCYGLFITTVSAELTTQKTSTGSFTPQVPEHTRRIHFVANQVLTDFAQDQFRNKSEFRSHGLGRRIVRPYDLLGSVLLVKRTIKMMTLPSSWKQPETR